MFLSITHCDNSGLIGVDGELAYKSTEDFKEFKRITKDSVLLMGKNTYQECGPLKNRQMLVLSSKGNTLDGKPFNGDFSKMGDIVLCGGPKVYKDYLPLCELVVLHVTKQQKILNPLNPAYFPLDTLQKLFVLESSKEFETFIQQIYLPSYTTSTNTSVINQLLQNLVIPFNYV